MIIETKDNLSTGGSHIHVPPNSFLQIISVIWFIWYISDTKIVFHVMLCVVINKWYITLLETSFRNTINKKMWPLWKPKFLHMYILALVIFNFNIIPGCILVQDSLELTYFNLSLQSVWDYCTTDEMWVQDSMLHQWFKTRLAFYIS